MPGTKISGRKTLSSGARPSANRARQALKMAAMSLSRSDSALGAFYRRPCARMDKPRANTPYVSSTRHERPADLAYRFQRFTTSDAKRLTQRMIVVCESERPHAAVLRGQRSVHCEASIARIT